MGPSSLNPVHSKTAVRLMKRLNPNVPIVIEYWHFVLVCRSIQIFVLQCHDVQIFCHGISWHIDKCIGMSRYIDILSWNVITYSHFVLECHDIQMACNAYSWFLLVCHYIQIVVMTYRWFVLVHHDIQMACHTYRWFDLGCHPSDYIYVAEYQSKVIGSPFHV